MRGVGALLFLILGLVIAPTQVVAENASLSTFPGVFDGAYYVYNATLIPKANLSMQFRIEFDVISEGDNWVHAHVNFTTTHYINGSVAEAHEAIFNANITADRDSLFGLFFNIGRLHDVLVSYMQSMTGVGLNETSSEPPPGEYTIENGTYEIFNTTREVYICEFNRTGITYNLTGRLVVDIETGVTLERTFIMKFNVEPTATNSTNTTKSLTAISQFELPQGVMRLIDTNLFGRAEETVSMPSQNWWLIVLIVLLIAVPVMLFVWLRRKRAKA